MIGLDCSTADNCDQDFVKEVLKKDWLKVQNQVKSLQKNLADVLFNSSDPRPHDTCPSSQPCSGQGFCKATYRVWSDGRPLEFHSRCANSTEQPELDWAHVVSQDPIFDEMAYTCNQRLCASQSNAEAIVELIQRNYVIPINITVPTTTTKSSTTTTTTPKPTYTPSTSASTSIATSTKSAARLTMNFVPPDAKRIAEALGDIKQL
ncbi:unnamed protein product [Rotaria sp. Silwood1]|nr:unnamed protein product [Rotaria sp. Silwood1]CAF1549418.1 unnamed protein product [Rotaria sp. Silwood1]CAF3705881.1 unnamed protein product [Rotaria sp. Silwood1]CAF3726137.1 unnamed protein product [Rotaria sp. Silwood1]CAF4782622.1 unnamed protein product [Rotaria sp. Silwood1]